MGKVQGGKAHPPERMKILFSIPTRGHVHKQTMFAIDRIMSDNRYVIQKIIPTANPYEHNLHRIMNQFMRGDYDYWLNMDDDNPAQNNPLDLVELDKDIISIPTPVWHWKGEAGERPIYFNAYEKQEDGYTEWPDKRGLQEVHAVGSGCMLIARRVFENPQMRIAPFCRVYNNDGIVERGCDVAFCERAREHGFKVWSHFDYRAEHIQEVGLLEVINAFGGLINA
jgi:hypothetical protein